MVEMTIVMVIVAVLMAVVIPTFRSGKQTATIKNTVVAAQSYRDAINAFMLDHSNRAPNLAAGSPDWPTSEATSGPRQPNLSGPTILHYMKTGAPDAVTSGKAGIAFASPAASSPPAAAQGARCAAASAGTPCGALTYSPVGVTGYSLVVWVRKSAGWVRQCTLTDGAGGDKC